MDIGWRTARAQAGVVGALLGVSMVVAACGSSSSTSSSAAANSSSSSASASVVSAKGTPVSATKGPDGTYLTGASGRALYLWVADSNGKSSCSGACAGVWPPLTTKGSPIASGGVTASNLGTITRSDGSKQVTYMGHPLYYFAGDSQSGMTKGEGSNQFGAKWWLVAPSGSAITKSGSSPVSSGSSSSSSGSGGGGWS